MVWICRFAQRLSKIPRRDINDAASAAVRDGSRQHHAAAGSREKRRVHSQFALLHQRRKQRYPGPPPVQPDHCVPAAADGGHAV